MMIDLRYLFKKHGIIADTILHLGSNEGQEADVYNELGVENVIWVEALKDVYDKLLENVSKYSGQFCINACVSDKNEKVRFHRSNNQSQSSSILELSHHKVIHPEVSYIETIELETFRVDQLIKEKDLIGECFLNADLQGAELMALKGMGNLLKRFDWAYLEVNKRETYKGCVLIDDLDVFMLQNNFERIETGKWVTDTWTDALYKRI